MGDGTGVAETKGAKDGAGDVTVIDWRWYSVIRVRRFNPGI